MKSKWTAPLCLLLILTLSGVAVFSGPNPQKTIDFISSVFSQNSNQNQNSDSKSESEISDHPEQESSQKEPDSHQESETIEKESVYLHYSLTSAQEDLFLAVIDKGGNFVSEVFSFILKYPNGSKKSYQTNRSGTWYATNLVSGNYEVTLQNLDTDINSSSGVIYSFANPKQQIKVNNRVIPRKIADISELKARVAGSDDEKEIYGIKEDDGSSYSIEIVPDDGDIYQGFICTYSVGPNGYLFYKGTQTESNVKPHEDETGALDYGLLDDGTRVELFWPDGEPFEDYEIKFEAPEDAKFGEVIENGKRYYYTAGGKQIAGPGLKKIGNKLYFITSDNVVSSSCGIDISAYQTITDWNAVKASGIDFVIIRLCARGWGTGDLFEDSKGKNWLQPARDAGLKVGAYVFSAAINTQEAIEEASLALDLLDGFELDYPLFFDTEFCNTSHSGRCDTLNKEQRTTIAKAFCQTVENEGVQAGIYASASFFCNQLDMKQLDSYMFWMAHYTKDFALSNYKVNYQIWQFTSSGTIDGIKGRVDMNTIFK